MVKFIDIRRSIKMKMSKRYLRLMFEPGLNVNVNHDDMMKHYFTNYLDGFAVEWSGIISFNAKRKKYDQRFEPLYQMHIWDSTKATREYLLEYLDRNPIIGYYVHVNEKISSAGNEAIVR